MRITKVKWKVKGFKTAYGSIFIKDEENNKIYEKKFIFDSESNVNTNIYGINNIVYKLINKGGLFTPNLELIKL